MASAKKGKKNKGKTLTLIDFLQETPGPVATIPIRKSTVNWADEVEDNHDVYDPRTVKTSLILPTAPKASRDFDDIIDKVPQDPPYIAYLTNLPYDVDENEISYFFRNMKIANMRIPKDERPGEVPRLKGFGYVEFEDRESLLNALVIPDTTLKNRRIRIEIATDYDLDKRRSGRMDMGRDRGGRSDVSMGDWRSGPRQENVDSDRRGFSRDREREREGDSSSSTWRDGDRRSNNRDMDRGGFNRPSERFNRDDRDQDFGRSRDERGAGGGGGFMSRKFDRDDRRNGGGFSRNPPPSSRGEEQDSNRNEPRQRPKLVLTPRTKPVETEPEKVSVTSSASIFGAAKPVDTSARERQIEERLLAKDSTEPPPPRRELSRERKDSHQEKENVGHRERKERDRVSESDKKSVEKEKTSTQHNQKGDVNGVVEKERAHHQKKNGDHEKKEPVKAESGGEKHNKPEVKKREEKKEKVEKEMPKVKKPEPPNFISSNAFAYLPTDDNSD